MLPQLDDERKEHVRFECLKAGREFFFENNFPGHWVLDDSSDEPLTLLGGPRKLFSESDPISLIPIEPTSHYSGLPRPGRVPGPCRLFTKKKQEQYEEQKNTCFDPMDVTTLVKCYSNLVIKRKNKIGMVFFKKRY